LGLAPRDQGPDLTAQFDVFIYLDAAEEDLEAGFLARFLAWRDLAKTDPSSFYARFVDMPLPKAKAFARKVWREINLPNLRDHICKGRAVADIVVVKDRGHGLRLIRSGARLISGPEQLWRRACAGRQGGFACADCLKGNPAPPPAATKISRSVIRQSVLVMF
jgi:hypothetical protein